MRFALLLFLKELTLAIKTRIPFSSSSRLVRLKTITNLLLSIDTARIASL